MKGIVIDNNILFREYFRTSQILINQDYEHSVAYETSTLLGTPSSTKAGMKINVSLKESQCSIEEKNILNSRDLLTEKLFNFVSNNLQLVYDYYTTDRLIQINPYEEVEVERSGIHIIERVHKRNPYFSELIQLSQTDPTFFGICEYITRFLLMNEIITVNSIFELRDFV